MNRRSAFTLIELLIVVAIIGILAAIAVPNYQNAMIRAKIARVQSDFKTIRTAMEMFHLDKNHYIRGFGNLDLSNKSSSHNYVINTQHRGGADWIRGTMEIPELTTPIAYLSSISILNDPFGENLLDSDGNRGNAWYTFGSGEFYKGFDFYPLIAKGWVLHSLGPDVYMGGPIKREDKDSLVLFGYPLGAHIRRYDSSNGLISNGDLHAFSGERPSPYTFDIDGEKGPKNFQPKDWK